MHLRFAHASERERVQAFIDRHWRRGHVLATSRRLLEWQHLDPNGERLNFLLLEEDEEARGPEPLGILGFIPTHQFDPGLERDRHLWLAIWKIREDARAGRAGLSMVAHLRDSLKPASMGSFGINEVVLPIYRWLGYRVSRLNQWVLMNPATTAPRIALPSSTAENPFCQGRAGDLVELTAEDLERNAGEIRALCEAGPAPPKSAEYLKRRYLDHPFYDYRVAALREGSRPSAGAVFRAQEAKGGACVRVVDAFGPGGGVAKCLSALCARLFEEPRIEHCDFFEQGKVPAEAMEAEGFRRVQDVPGLVVPSYFEPFVAENVTLESACWCETEQPYAFVKGDCDQDRPNTIAAEPT